MYLRYHIKYKRRYEKNLENPHPAYTITNDDAVTWSEAGSSSEGWPYMELPQVSEVTNRSTMQQGGAPHVPDSTIYGPAMRYSMGPIIDAEPFSPVPGFGPVASSITAYLHSKSPQHDGSSTSYPVAYTGTRSGTMEDEIHRRYIPEGCTSQQDTYAPLMLNAQTLPGVRNIIDSQHTDRTLPRSRNIDRKCDDTSGRTHNAIELGLLSRDKCVKNGSRTNGGRASQSTDEDIKVIVMLIK